MYKNEQLNYELFIVWTSKNAILRHIRIFLRGIVQLKEKLIVVVIVIFTVLSAVYLYMHLPMFVRAIAARRSINAHSKNA